MNNFEAEVLVVGSGAGGAMAAYELTKAGRKVLLLEAGRDYDPKSETPMFKRNGEAPLMGAGNSDKDFGFYDATVDGGWQVPGEPYTQASREPQQRFDWWRARMLGGRTNHWGRISLRFGPKDFKRKDVDGLGENWPISYDDLQTAYCRAEEEMGVSADVASQTYLGVTFPQGYKYSMHGIPPSLVDQGLGKHVTGTVYQSPEKGPDGKPYPGVTLNVRQTPAGRNSRPSTSTGIASTTRSPTWDIET